MTVFAFSGSDASQGSGFVVSSRGVILTNSHVITNAGDAPVPRPSSRRATCSSSSPTAIASRRRVVGWDVFDDIGVLQVDAGEHPVAPLPLGDSSRVVIGEPVAAIGSPFGNTDSLSVGVVSATRSIASLTSTYDVVDAIQTDAPINHGNSGGPCSTPAGV